MAAEDETTLRRLLSERRDELSGERTRTANRLHRLLRDLRPGGASGRLLVRERLRIARELVTELQVLDRRLRASRERIEAQLRDRGSRLIELPGVGPVTAAKLIGRSGSSMRFANRHHYASYAGVAPLEASSAEVKRHRLNRRGDRQLNSALHMMALTQIRMTGCAGQVYYRRTRAEGKSHREAMRCLKRRLADVVYRELIAGEERLQPTPN